jgi:hypothetical protein
MTLKEIWEDRSWRFLFWLTAALLAYRTAPDAGFPLWLSVLTGALYIVLWVLLLRRDAREESPRTALVWFMLVLMALMLVTLVLTGAGINLPIVALLWLVPVGMPIQGLVRLVSDSASRSDGAMAAASLALMAALLALRFFWYKNRTKGQKGT